MNGVFLFFCLFYALALFAHSNDDREYTESLQHENIKIPFGLEPIEWPEDNPYSFDKYRLGRWMFFEARLSADGTISCSSCHLPTNAYSDVLPKSVGIHNQEGKRRAPSLINVAYQKSFFWDGRAESLEEQAKGPISNSQEMSDCANKEEALHTCLKRLKDLTIFNKHFNHAFNCENYTLEEVVKSIATFERTLLSGNSPYDQYIQGKSTALNESQIRGYEVFKSSNCISCHSGFNFTNNDFANTGVGLNHENPDLGRFEITKNIEDWGKFKIPTLREINSRSPYMHDGSFETLKDVIEHYNSGGIKNQNLDERIVPLNLSTLQKQDLEAFLISLTGEGWHSYATQPQSVGMK